MRTPEPPGTQEGTTTVNILKFRLASIALSAAAVATLATGAINATSALAAPSDEPWPEPPSCSNETGTCTSIEDQLAYECYFVEDDEGIEWCETDLEDMLDMQRDPGTYLKAELPAPPPPPVARLVVAR
jgi:hypothetical protein